MSSKNQDYYVREFNLCDRNHFWILKGISALFALIAAFCYFFFRIDTFLPAVYIASAVFVLCSGFGLSESFLKKKGLVHYWENKLIKIWVPSVVVVVVLNIIQSGNIASWIARTPLGLKTSLLYLIFGGYGVFWLVFQMMDSKASRLIALFACAVAVFFFVPSKYGVRELALAFPVGVLLSQTGWKRAMMKANWGIRIAVLAGLLVMAVGCGILANMLQIPYVQPLLWSVCLISAALSLFLLTYYLQKITIWGAFVPIGWISYTLYLTYDGIFIMFANKKDAKMYVVLVIVVFAVAALLAWLRELLISWNYKMRRKGKTHLKGSMG